MKVFSLEGLIVCSVTTVSDVGMTAHPYVLLLSQQQQQTTLNSIYCQYYNINSIIFTSTIFMSLNSSVSATETDTSCGEFVWYDVRFFNRPNYWVLTVKSNAFVIYEVFFPWTFKVGKSFCFLKSTVRTMIGYLQWSLYLASPNYSLH